MPEFISVLGSYGLAKMRLRAGMGKGWVMSDLNGVLLRGDDLLLIVYVCVAGLGSAFRGLLRVLSMILWVFFKWHILAF